MQQNKLLLLLALLLSLFVQPIYAAGFTNRSRVKLRPEIEILKLLDKDFLQTESPLPHLHPSPVAELITEAWSTRCRFHWLNGLNSQNESKQTGSVFKNTFFLQTKLHSTSDPITNSHFTASKNLTNMPIVAQSYYKVKLFLTLSSFHWIKKCDCVWVKCF